MISLPQRHRWLACMFTLTLATGLIIGAPLEKAPKDTFCTSTNGQVCKSPGNRAAFLAGQAALKSSATNSPTSVIDSKNPSVKPPH